MKRIIILFLSLVVCSVGFAQIKAGTIKLSLNLGHSPYVDYVQAPYQGNGTQTIDPYEVDHVYDGGYSLINMIGFEAKYFFTENIAAKFLGGGQTINTPARLEQVGSDLDGSFDPQVDVPNYNSVPESKISQFMAIVGADYYVTRNNISIYGGVEGGFRYGAAQSKGVDAGDAGTSIKEIYGYNGAITLGGEYNATSGFFMGIEVRPFSYNYSITTIQPISVSSFQATSTTLGYFVFPMLKVGVNF